MQAKLTTSIKPIFKYVYLVTFFTLLAGFFYPAIHRISFDGTIVGVFTLFVGLAGSVLVYKSTREDTRYPTVYLVSGAMLWLTCTYLIYLVAGFV